MNLSKILGPFLNLLVVYSLWYADLYSKNKYYAYGFVLLHILALASIPTIPAILYWY